MAWDEGHRYICLSTEKRDGSVVVRIISTSWVQEVSRKYKEVKLSPNKEADLLLKVPPPIYLSCRACGPGLKSATTEEVSKFTVCTHDTHGQLSPSYQHVSAELN